MEDKVLNLETPRDPLTGKIISCAVHVHQQLGPGLLESVYEECLSLTLHKEGISHQRQISMPIIFDGKAIENAYKLDMLVDNNVVLELKAVEKVLPVHEAQILTYLKLSKVRTGLLINFNSKLLKEGIKRYVV